jgi:biopolymer transport protein ExbB
MTSRRVIFALLVLLVPVAASAASWWNGAWPYRKEIGLDLSATGANVPGTVKNVPVLVRLSLANFAYFNDTKPDGSDFRVIAGDDHTPLAFHFERYDAKNQMAYLWIRVPQLTGGSNANKVYLYYGNSAAKAAGNAAGTFDADQTLVLEFDQASGLPRDLTAYHNNPSASTAKPAPASLIAGGAQFSGTESITIPSSPSLSLQPSQGYTASAWVRLDAAQQQADVISLAQDSAAITLGIDGLHAFARYEGAAAPVTVTQTGSLSTGAGAWHELALTAGGGKLTLYVDGVIAGQAQVQLEPIGGTAGTLTIGNSAGGGNGLTADLDEVAVSRVARSADWMRAVEASEGPKAPLVIYGEDGRKASSGGEASYYITIAKNITADGWTIIVTCLTMLLLALGIMTLKALYLGRIERCNRVFLRDYHQMAADTDARALDQRASGEEEEFEEEAPELAGIVGHEGKYGDSTLYRLYHMGVAELNKRLAGRAAGAQRAQILSAQSVEAIRASMDATATRLQQRTGSQMVLLTIAISGGPFLGLLGTVIGVMITFAAIAASGNVTVNAIAPGIAAALAATVSGLAVAIPCLFGYNWLNTRIRAITANNRVFLDEFVARLAEQYS